MLEKHFQSKVIKEIKKMFKGSIVLKTDPTYIQGIPDLLILYKKHWAALEVKQSPKRRYHLSSFSRNEETFLPRT